ncbi:MAG: hypothetical protein NWF06_05095 [Candidatus Bathyarchaeota archaeon]|nr:hypothetical protein [Candidatus Bathyarchaeum sp.]
MGLALFVLVLELTHLPLLGVELFTGVLTSLPPLRRLLPNLPIRLLRTPYVSPPRKVSLRATLRKIK